MIKPFGTTLFLVASPFQCLCMLEAINYFNIVDFDVLITYSDDFSLNNIDALLKEKDIPYKKRQSSHIIYGILPHLFSKHKYYKNIFIGDFYSKNRLILAYIYAHFKADLYYLDDGVQALQFFSHSPRKINYKFKVKVVLMFYELIRFAKNIKKPVFFTIFNVSSTKHKIINNPFLLLKSKTTDELKGIYIIGTNSSILDFKDYSYIEYLTALHKYISDRFPHEKIYYCPHRRDENINEIYHHCDKLNIEIFDTRISVEYDFIDKSLNPKLITGFTSNALYTLRVIYPKSIIETVMYNLKNKLYDEETDFIRTEMSKSGIDTINIL